MTIASIVSRASFTGNGATTVFSFPYYFLANADLKVIRKKISDGTETILVLDTDYTVSGAGVAAGGSITTIGALSPISSAYKLTIYRDPQQIQEMDLVENDPSPAETSERAFDLLTMISQRLSNWISRTMKLSEGMPDGVFDPTLPVDIALYPNTVPLLNSTGSGFELASLWPTADDVNDAETWALLAEDWATKTTALVTEFDGVTPVDNSAKAYAIGGSGAGQPAGGDAKSWAIKTSSFVTAGNFSAKEWAIGIQNRGLANGGSAKDWANYTLGTVDNAEYSAKKYAVDAAASAAAAAASVASVIWKDVVFKTFADSPITLSASDKGKLYSIDASGGAVVVNLPQISLLDLSTPFAMGIKKTDSSANKITLKAYNAGDGTEKIDGANSKDFDVQNSGAVVIPDVDPSPDAWTTAAFGDATAGGGGGGALRWIEAANAPIMNVETDQEVYNYEAAQSQDLFTNIRVPSTYTAGHQIKMKLLWLSNDSSGNVLMKAQSTLIRPASSVITSTTNQRTTTNTAVTVSGATQEKPQLVTLDLTDTSGQINGVAVLPGDLIKVRLYRDTDTATGDVRALPYNAEVTFT